MAAVTDGLNREHPNTNAGRGAMLEGMRPAVIGGDLRRTSMLFLGVVGFVLLTCCANVANLLMPRTTARRGELALRTALGADRLRVIRQLLAETLVLSMLGGGLGLAVGVVILNVAPSVMPPALLAAAVSISFDWRAVAFSGAAALLVGGLFGLAPAWRATRIDPVVTLRNE
jgi:putative ABC transport system permease protein